ncbi:MAG: serine/threonine-protein kinase [Polyangiales bacterium]
MTAGSSSSSRPLAPTEESPKQIRKLMQDAVPLTLATALTDVAYWQWVEPAAKIAVIFALRAVMLAMYATVGWALPMRNEREAMRAMWGTGLFTASATAVMAHAAGGLRSLYGLGALMLAIGAASAARPRKQAYGLQFTVLGAYLAVFALLAPFNPLVIAQWSQQGSRGFFAVIFGTSVVATALSCELSFALWALRREVYESKRVGQYVLRKRIGLGGMGEVWSAWHVALKREVAVKFLHAQMSDEYARKRFEREAQATASLEHPNIVRILDAGISEDGQPYYAMELLSGSSLRALVDEGGPLSQARAVKLIEQCARALGEAHARGIIHRDVKPENLFVCSPGEGERAKVVDFGIAKVIEATEGESKLSSTGWLAGTPAYMAPEVVCGEDAGAESDVYALGGALYFALTGEPPFAGASASAVLFAHVSRPVDAPSAKLERPIDARLEGIILRCLSKERTNRYADARALAEALAALGSLSEAPIARASRGAVSAGAGQSTVRDIA